MILGDASMYKGSREAYIKFEQGHKQKIFLDNLFSIFKTYTFMEKPGKRLYLSGLHKGFCETWFFKHSLKNLEKEKVFGLKLFHTKALQNYLVYFMNKNYILIKFIEKRKYHKI